MKRAWTILISGLAAAALGYFAFYHFCTAGARNMEHSEMPELAWLKAEFHLGDAEYRRISALHESYLEGCTQRCRLIDKKNEALKALLARTNAVTPEIQQALAEAAQLRTECQKQMLEHFYEVSRSMPPEQGRRYLVWVHERTLHTDAHHSMQ